MTTAAGGRVEFACYHTEFAQLLGNRAVMIPVLSYTTGQQRRAASMPEAIRK